MLSNELMGAFCLGVVWLNTLLIAAHVWQAQRALAEDARKLGPVVFASVVASAEGASLAELRVAQVGRAITTGGPDRILFTEASRAARVHAGAVEASGARVSVTPADAARVWSFEAAGARADTFDAAFESASTNRGLRADLVVPVGAPGAKVWLAGEREGDALRVRLVSDRDPASVVRAGRVRALAFIAASLAVLGGVTALALVRPWFSGLSTLGGVLAVAYFLAVQPLAVALREAIAPPEDRRIGGVWQRPAP